MSTSILSSSSRMARLIAVLMLFLHACEVLLASGAVTVLRQQEEDLILHLNKSAQFPKSSTFFWKFNGNSNIGRIILGTQPYIFPPYEGRVEIKPNYTFILKNLRDNDSGRYTAEVLDSTDRTEAEYEVVVTVPPVQLKVVWASASSGTCNLTVTCRTGASNISSTFRSTNQTMEQKGGEQPEVTRSGSSLHVFLLNGSIVCNHSNQVSWTKDTTEVQAHCLENADESTPQTKWIFLLLIPLIVPAGVGLNVCLRKCRSRNPDSQDHEVPPEIYQIESPNPRDEPSVLTSTYVLVEFPKRLMECSSVNQTSQIDTLYSQVDRASKVNHRRP